MRPGGRQSARASRERRVPAVDELSSLDDPLDLLDAVHRLDIKRGPATPRLAEVGGSKAEVVAHLEQARQARTEILGLSVPPRPRRSAPDSGLHARRGGAAPARGVAHFHDLLVLTRDLLRSDADVRRRLHERYPGRPDRRVPGHRPSAGRDRLPDRGDGDRWPRRLVRHSGDEGRLFFVGDAKQSIYRFRRADVALYSSVGDRFTSGRTKLDVNFRSVPAVLYASTTCSEISSGRRRPARFRTAT